MNSTERSRRSRERRKLRLAAPSMIAKAADANVPDDALTPLEAGLRGFRRELLADLGGAAGLSLTKRLQLDAFLERWLVKEMLAREVLDLAVAGVLVNRRSRRAAPILLDWLRVTDSFDRAANAVGLSRASAAQKSLAERIQEEADRWDAEHAQGAAPAQQGHARATDPEPGRGNGAAKAPDVPGDPPAVQETAT